MHWVDSPPEACGEEYLRMRDIVKRLSQSALTSLTSRKASAKFADVIPADAIFDVPLDAVAFVILNSLKNLQPGTTMYQHMQVRAWSDSYPRDARRQVELRLIEAWQHLQQQGLIAPTKVMGVWDTWFVTAKGLAVSESSQISFGPAELLPRALLHKQIADEVLPLYLAGRYDEACGTAFKLLEICVRDLAKVPVQLVGVELMREAFKPDVGPLTFRKALPAEQLAAREMFSGAMGYYRNAFAHRRIGISEPRLAASIILLANELLGTAIRHYKLQLPHEAPDDSQTS